MVDDIQSIYGIGRIGKNSYGIGYVTKTQLSFLVFGKKCIMQTSIIYASQADVLNMALFGMTAKRWQDKNPDKKAIFVIMLI